MDLEKAIAQAIANAFKADDWHVVVVQERRVMAHPRKQTRFYIGKRKVTKAQFLSDKVSHEREDLDVIRERDHVEDAWMLTNGKIEVLLTENYRFDDSNGIYPDTAEARLLSERSHVSRVKP